jgi:hypothetical protein
MKLRPMGAEFFLVEGQTNELADWRAGRLTNWQTDDLARTRFSQFCELT